nr:unnamed protein product [Spirometra erinaceieuropaei]
MLCQLATRECLPREKRRQTPTKATTLRRYRQGQPRCYKDTDQPEDFDDLVQSRPAWRREMKTRGTICETNWLAVATAKRPSRLATPTPSHSQHVRTVYEHNGSAMSDIAGSNPPTAGQSDSLNRCLSYRPCFNPRCIYYEDRSYRRCSASPCPAVVGYRSFCDSDSEFPMSHFHHRTKLS